MVIDMKVIFGCDPNANELKNTLMAFAKSLNYEVVDFGSDDPIYANTAIKVAQAVTAARVTAGFSFAAPE